MGIECPFINTGVSRIHCLESAALLNLYRLCVYLRLSCRLAAVKSIIDDIVSLCLKHNFQTFLLLIDSREALCLKDMWTIIVTHNVVDSTEIIRTVNKSLPALVLRLTPLHFAECSHTRKEHIEKVVCCRDVFGPEISLNSQDMSLLLISHISSEWLIRI